MRVNLQPAFLLHSRPYRDSSQLLEVFTPEYGRLSLVGRGVHRKARGGSLRATLQPFRPLLLSFSGRSELQSLVSAEPAGLAITLRGERLFSGLYLNELLLRLLHSQSPHQALFAYYGETLHNLSGEAAIDTVLRCFELRLLDELGYGFDPLWDVRAQSSVKAEAWYEYHSGLGLVECHSQAAPEHSRFAGHDLQAIAKGQFGGARSQVAKRLLRQVIAEHLGGRPLHTRELFRQFRQKAVQ